uniref:Bcl-2 Bcl-2 homology region 1-3 domain-containing protein n=1 Tax=Callorhinchus milii TaxID=7868 RepID=A0A4W3H3E3_CALMI
MRTVSVVVAGVGISNTSHSKKQNYLLVTMSIFSIGIVNHLNISGKRDLNAIKKVGTEMFSDGEMNWGRVVSFIAFGAVMGEHLAKLQLDDLIDLMAEEITQYLTQQKREWLQKHNGWVRRSFGKPFDQENQCT